MDFELMASMMCADYRNLEKEVKELDEGGIDSFHIDIMDGRYVQNYAMSLNDLRCIRSLTNKPLDVHLMVTNPLRFIEPFAKAGADLLTVHVESQDDTLAALKAIQALGIKTGVSIKPDTDPAILNNLTQYIDLILVMSVYPGFGGQTFLESAPAQIKAVRQIINASGKQIWLEVDGGINAQTAPLAIGAGADALVAGHAIFKAADPELALKQIKQAAPEILTAFT